MSLEVEIFIEIALWCTISEVYVFLAFHVEIQDGRPVYTLQIKIFIEIVLSRSISKINVSLHFPQNLRWPPKMVGKHFYGKSGR